MISLSHHAGFFTIALFNKKKLDSVRIPAYNQSGRTLVTATEANIYLAKDSARYSRLIGI